MSLLIQQKGHTLWATIERRQAHNAINFEVMDALEDTLDRIEKDKSVRTFVLSGSGSSFISGGDLKEFHTIKTAEEAKPMALRMVRIFQRMEKLPCWTVACINGPAYGGGWETMLACDFRIAAHSATFGFTQGKFYLPPGWGGLTRLVERVGRSTALKWLAGAVIINAETALSHKLIDKVETEDELERKTWEWAEALSHNDRDFIGNLKKASMQLTRARWEAIQSELEPFASFWEDERHHERVQKFIDRR